MFDVTVIGAGPARSLSEYLLIGQLVVSGSLHRPGNTGCSG